MKEKLISILFHNTIVNVIFPLFSIIGLVFLVYITASLTPKSWWWFFDIIFNFLGILVIAYVIYVVIRFVLVFGDVIGKKDSVIGFFKETLKK